LISDRDSCGETKQLFTSWHAEQQRQTTNAWVSSSNLQLGVSSEQWPYRDSSRPARRHRPPNPRRSFAVRVGLHGAQSSSLAQEPPAACERGPEMKTISTAPPLYPQLPCFPGGQRHMQTSIHPGMCIHDSSEVHVVGAAGATDLPAALGVLTRLIS